jgi:hypothetical protein
VIHLRAKCKRSPAQGTIAVKRFRLSVRHILYPRAKNKFMSQRLRSKGYDAVTRSSRAFNIKNTNRPRWFRAFGLMGS